MILSNNKHTYNEVKWEKQFCIRKTFQ
uniref:Uncharacterized protein n=1 Tax=Tetranychus urticae TaxID=32264 RepID=T1KIM6_TETUR